MLGHHFFLHGLQSLQTRLSIFFFIITNLHFYKSVNENRNVSRTKQVQWLKYKGDEESSAREIALYREIEGFEK